MNKFFTAFLLIIILFGCKEKTIDLGKDISFNQETDISYGTDPEQKMDLYIPKTKDSIKGVFIIIHGGGWKAGNKSNLKFFTLSLMKKMPNFAFANINYRLASINRFGIPNQTNDIEKAIAFIKTTLKSNPTFVLLGNSAGAHLSMLYSYKFNRDNKIKAVVNIVGPTDLSDPNFKNYSDYSFVENHLIDSNAIPDGITIDKFASPVSWISTTSSPTLSFYGNNDQIIPFSQKVILDSALNKNKVFNKSFEFSGEHLDWGNYKNSLILINKIDEFLKHIE